VTQVGDSSASFNITYSFIDGYKKKQSYDAFYYDSGRSWKINADKLGPNLTDQQF